MNKKYTYIIIVLLIVFSFIAFGRILGNDFINLDDIPYITENVNIKSGINAENVKWAFTTIYFNYWQPLTWLSHMLDWGLFGANASGHHLINLLLHIGAVLFLFLFLNKTTKNIWPSAFAAAFFALHPLRVESVAWAAERKDVLSMFFGMASLYAYAYYVESSRLSKYFLCLILFALSLMAKPMLVTLPFIMLLLDYWPLGRWPKPLNHGQNDQAQIAISKPQKKKGKKNKAGVIGEKKISVPAKSSRQIVSSLLGEKAPFIFLAIAVGIVTFWAQNKVGAIVSLEKLSFSARIFNAVISYVAYLGKIFWPVNLAVFYPYQPSLPSWQIFGASAILVILTIVVIYTIKRTPFLFVGWFWYLGTLFPVIGLAQAGLQAMADRFTYLPSIGIGIMLIWGIGYLLPKEKLRKIILIPAAAIVLSVLTFLTWQQCGYWKNSVILYTQALETTKNNDLAHYNLGLALKEQGKMEEALNEFRSAIKIIPDYVDAHNNLGIILEMYFKKYDEAIYHYRQALRSDDNNYGVHYNLGIALAKTGDLKEAIQHFRRAIELNPDYEEARRALNLVLSIEQKQKK